MGSIITWLKWNPIRSSTVTPQLFSSLRSHSFIHSVVGWLESGYPSPSRPPTSLDNEYSIHWVSCLDFRFMCPPPHPTLIFGTMIIFSYCQIMFDWPRPINLWSFWARNLTHISFRIHYRTFGAKCSRCCRSISATDWVRRARNLVFHLACFACDACGRQLSTGEHFALLEDRVLCKMHYLEIVDGCVTSSDGELLNWILKPFYLIFDGFCCRWLWCGWIRQEQVKESTDNIYRGSTADPAG